MGVLTGIINLEIFDVLVHHLRDVVRWMPNGRWVRPTQLSAVAGDHMAHNLSPTEPLLVPATYRIQHQHHVDNLNWQF